MLNIQAKVLGRNTALIPRWQIPLPPSWSRGGSPLTLRDVITYIVQQEVAAFQQRQNERRLTRVLTAAQIEDGAAKGKIAMGGDDLEQVVEEPAAIGAALQAFEDGIYFVFIDDLQCEGLDREVVVRPDSHITFIRLVALAGG